MGLIRTPGKGTTRASDMDASLPRPAAAPEKPLDPRTRLLLEAPVARTVVRLAAPNMVVMVGQASVGLIETYFIGRLGSDALAGVALVFPAVMLMQMMSAGAIGGGISSAIARALGQGRREEAETLAAHGLAIGVGFALAFTVAALLGGRLLYSTMGGVDASLDAALTYSHIIFTGAILCWLFNSLASIIRGTGNMTTPATVIVVGTLVLIPLSPLLISGWGPFPAFGVAGGAIAMLLYYGVGTLVLAAYLRSGRSVIGLKFRGVRLRWSRLVDILRVGLLATAVVALTNITIAAATGLVGTAGPMAIAGYGAAARLEYLMLPISFGLGSPLVPLVGTCIGAGLHGRALRIAWTGAGITAAITGAVGIWAAFFPYAWISLFSAEPAVIEIGARYLRIVGPFYGLLGLGMGLYFASQGAGRMFWPATANAARLIVAAGGGWLALRLTGDISYVFAALGAALAIFGLINAAAVWGGSLFGKRST